MAGYNYKKIEAKWQKHWDENDTFRQPNPGEEGFADRPKFYVLDMFPYPSGVGLHVGHPLGYIATDIFARHKRMTGFNVLHPMGYDSFGLPAEQYAVEHGLHPRKTTAANIENMRRQLKGFGLSYDWSRELATTDVAYFRWTQWIFEKLFKSWYDPEANAARPIGELVRRLESGDYCVDFAGRPMPNVHDGLTAYLGQPIGTIKWHELPPEQRREIIDSHRLAYQAEVPVNWCPQLGTVLANEEVTNEGRSDRGNYPVYRRPLRQWMLRITAYADRLLDDLALVDWPESIKIMQRNWIGKSTGAEVDFPLASVGTDEWFQGRAEGGYPGVEEEGTIRVYTTRPDTLFGATYMVLAPEHPLVEAITTDEQRDEVRAYVEAAGRKSELERTAEAKEKTGVFTGAHAVNPVNREEMPIWVADYVMMGYGTGAIMAVPAHDTRDYDFATALNLPVIRVVDSYQCSLRAGPLLNVLKRISLDDIQHTYHLGGTISSAGGVIVRGKRAQIRLLLKDAQLTGEVEQAPLPYVGDGVAVNSGKYDGQPTPEFIPNITADLAAAGLGRAAINYKLRDWLFSRQRYWGEPFPIIHCEQCGTVSIPESELPLELPEMEDFSPGASDDPEALPSPPLSRASEWIRTTCPHCAGPASRETNTMPQWAGSCWYYLRFCDPANDRAYVDADIERYWMGPNGVDLYVGGVEHAVLHLLYARFWHKVLYDLGHAGTPEPFGKLFNQGYIQAPAYTDSRGVYVPAEEVEEIDGQFVYQGQPVTREYGKMGKSLKNAVNPDDVIAKYGADTLRLYELFMGPLEASKPWNTRDVQGGHRFCQRAWRMIAGDDEREAMVTEADADEAVERGLHKLIKKAGEDIESLKFNTAIAAMMEFVNLAYKAERISGDQAERFVLVLSPFAPHLAEELWERLGHEGSLAYEPWPAYDEAMIAEETIELAVQVNGKVRGRVSVPAEADDAAVLEAALAEPKVAAALEGKTVVKKIVVPGRLVNVVVK